MTMLCERCKREIFEAEPCNYCNRKIGVECEKSSRRYMKTTRLVICKDCWGDIKKRTAFKSNRVQVKVATEES